MVSSTTWRRVLALSRYERTSKTVLGRWTGHWQRQLAKEKERLKRTMTYEHRAVLRGNSTAKAKCQSWQARVCKLVSFPARSTSLYLRLLLSSASQASPVDGSRFRLSSCFNSNKARQSDVRRSTETAISLRPTFPFVPLLCRSSSIVPPFIISFALDVTAQATHQLSNSSTLSLMVFFLRSIRISLRTPYYSSICLR